MRQNPKDLSGESGENFEVIEQIMRLGISENEAKSLYTKYGEEEVNNALMLVQKRQQSITLRTLEHSGAYFKDTLKNGYAQKNSHVAQPKPRMIITALKTPLVTLEEQYNNAHAKKAMGYFHELSADEQDAYLTRFSEQASKKLVLTRTNLEQRKSVNSEFSRWLAKNLWGSPTEKDLIDYCDAGKSFTGL